MDDTITKAQLARELGVGRSAVTFYVRRGMPVLPNGRLSRTAALAWLRVHVWPLYHPGKGAAVAHRAVSPRGVPIEPDTPVRHRHRAMFRTTDPFSAGARYAAVEMAYRLPAVAAVVTAIAGAAPRACYAAYAAVQVAAAHSAREVAGMGADEEFIDPEGFDAVDWGWIAEQAGEPVNVELWERWKRERFGQDRGEKQAR